MEKNELVLTVPSYFKCPISLDVMKSPVSLCTGVTYDRTSIQTWLDNGNNTCPATMQPLLSKDLIPNSTLQRLIHTWEQQSDSQPLSLLKRLSTPKTPLLESLISLSDFLQQSDKETKRFLVSSGLIPALAPLLPNIQKPDESEAFVRVLRLIVTDSKKKLPELETIDPDLLSSLLILILEKGNSLESRTDSALVLEAMITIEDESCSKISYRSVAEKESSLVEFLRLMKSGTDSRAIDAGISCLIALSARRKIRSQIVRLGAVPVLANLLVLRSESRIAEKVLKMMEMASTCAEGRAAICDDPVCVTAIVQRILKVSGPATERAVVVVWSLCHLFRDRKAQDAVAKSNGLTKMLLLMQSDCSAHVKQMARDLVKIFRVNSKSCLFSYDTKTTHIMPF